MIVFDSKELRSEVHILWFSFPKLKSLRIVFHRNI